MERFPNDLLQTITFKRIAPTLFVIPAKARALLPADRLVIH
jgi:hypothetical protein